MNVLVHVDVSRGVDVTVVYKLVEHIVNDIQIYIIVIRVVERQLTTVWDVSSVVCNALDDCMPLLL